MKTIAPWLARLVLGGTFAYAAVQKILDPAAFVADIGHYRLLPHPFSLMLGVYLPWIELICSIGVIIRWRERAALLLTAGMCAFFFVALTSARLRGLDISCGCFGHTENSPGLSLAIVRSLGLGAVTLFLFKQSRLPEARL